MNKICETLLPLLRVQLGTNNYEFYTKKMLQFKYKNATFDVIETFNLVFFCITIRRRYGLGVEWVFPPKGTENISLFYHLNSFRLTTPLIGVLHFYENLRSLQD